MMEIHGLARKVQEKLGEEYTVSVQEVKKNNILKYGLQIAGPTSENEGLTSIIYPDVDDTPESIMEQYKQIKMLESSIDTKIEKWKDHCVFFVTGDYEYAKMYVHKKVANLYAVLCVCCEATYTYKINVTEPLLDKWNVEAKDAWDIAYKNMERDVTISSLMEMGDWLQGNGRPGKAPQNLFRSKIIENREPALIVSNKGTNLGAGCILVPKVQKWLLNYYGGSCIILPSSIHEVIATRFDEEDVSDLLTQKMTVVMTNSREVNDVDILSDNIYLLDHRGLHLIF